MKYKNKQYFQGLGLAVIINFSSPPSEAASGQLEEVLVTAQKREQNLQDVPMAVSAISAELLAQNEIDSIKDLTKLVPSLRFSGDGAGLSLRMRGVGTDVFSVAVEPNVAVLVDGIPLARNSLANFDFADIQRVEVLRGPQGTLFGKNASAGLVHVITQDPAAELQARIRSSYQKPQNFPGDFTKTQFSVSGPLTEALGVRLTGFGKQVNGHLEDIEQRENLQDSDQFGARSKLRWDVSDQFSIRLGVEYQKEDGQGPPLIYRSGNPGFQERSRPLHYSEKNRRVRTRGTQQQDSEVLAQSVTLDWQLQDFTITAITALRDAERADFLGAARLSGDRIGLEQGALLDIKTFTQEVRLLSPNSEEFEYTIGAFWFDNKLDRVFNRLVDDVPATFVAGLPNPPDLSGMLGTSPDTVVLRDHLDSFVDTQNLGIFGQATWHFNARWHLTAGARFIDEELNAGFYTFSRIYDGATDTLVDGASSEFRSDKSTVGDREFTGTLSIQYDWGDHSTIYSTISKGYRGAAFDIVVGSTQESVDNPVDPEIAKSFEVGIKSRLFDRKLEINATAFLTKFQDFQAQIIDLSGGVGAADFRLDNAGELETRGIELDFKARPFAPLFVYGSILFNRAVFNEFTTQCFVGQNPGEAGGRDLDDDGSCDVQDAAGGVLPNAPKLSMSLTTRYEHVFQGARNTVYGQITGRWQDDVQFNAEQHPNAILGSYGVWDLRFGWHGFGDRVEIAGYVNNLFRQNYANVLIPLSLEGDRRDILHGLPVGADRIFGTSIAWQL